MKKTSVAVFVIALGAVFAVSPVAEAQILQRVRDGARQQVEKRVERRAAEAVERGLNRTEDALTCVIGNQECLAQAEREGRQVVLTDASGSPVADQPGTPGAGATARPGDGAWANYDFVPGTRTLFAEDFTADRVGNFPRRLEFIGGNIEVVEWQGGRYLRSTSEGSFDIVLPEALPERFTVEFDLFDPSFWATYVYPVDPARDAADHTRAFFAFNGHSGLVNGHLPSGPQSSVRVAPLTEMMRVSLTADGRYVKVYLNEQRVANMPVADFARTNRLRFDLPGSTSEERPVLIGNVRVAAGGAALYDAIVSNGRVTTQGILFASGSDRIRPESTPTLVEIGEMLRQHSALRLRIEGHTDNVGGEAANNALSERRAQAVRQHLIASYGVAPARLEAVGLGPSQPASSNDTAEGRQDNRRVVLVRL